MKEPTKPIFWRQGLFLQPQHFQQNDLHAQALLQPLQTLVQPFFWGVVRISIRESALKNQVLDIVDGDFLFRDGTWITYPGNALLQPRSFKDNWDTSDKPLKVYLGVRQWTRAENNVSILMSNEDLQAARTRYVSPVDPEQVGDLYQPGTDGQVPFLYHALKIFWEGEIENAGHYELLPIAQLEFDGNHTALSRRFAPPTPTVSSSPILGGVLKNIREQITARCRVLEEYKQPRGWYIQEGDANALTYLLALRSLNRCVPLLHHIADTPHVHPWNVYALLRELVGELSTFTDRIDCLGRLKDGTPLVPPYDHERPGDCFLDAQTLVEELLNAIMVGAENVIPFRRDGDYFYAQLPGDLFDSRSQAYLLLRSGSPKEELEGLVHRTVKISSVERMPTLVRRALPGMSLDQISVVPPGLPRRPDSLYFKLDRSSTDWEDIQKHGNICLFWSGAPDETVAEIIVIKR